MSQCTYFSNIWPAVVLACSWLLCVFCSSTPCVLCIETKIKIVNQNKEKITLKIFTWDRVCVGIRWRFGLLKKNSGKQKSNILRIETKVFLDVSRIPWEKKMHSTIYEGLSYHIHLLKSRVVYLGVIFLNTELNKPTFLCYEMSFLHYLLQIKQNVYSRHISCFCSDTIYSKV